MAVSTDLDKSLTQVKRSTCHASAREEEYRRNDETWTNAHRRQRLQPLARADSSPLSRDHDNRCTDLLYISLSFAPCSSSPWGKRCQRASYTKPPKRKQSVYSHTLPIPIRTPFPSCVSFLYAKMLFWASYSYSACPRRHVSSPSSLPKK